MAEYDFDFTHDEEERLWYDEMARMDAQQTEHMLNDMFEREVLQPVTVTDRDFLGEVFQILEGEPIEAERGHIVALGKYYAAKLSLVAA